MIHSWGVTRIFRVVLWPWAVSRRLWADKTLTCFLWFVLQFLRLQEPAVRPPESPSLTLSLWKPKPVKVVKSLFFHFELSWICQVISKSELWLVVCVQVSPAEPSDQRWASWTRCTHWACPAESPQTAASTCSGQFSSLPLSVLSAKSSKYERCCRCFLT